MEVWRPRVMPHPEPAAFWDGSAIHEFGRISPDRHDSSKCFSLLRVLVCAHSIRDHAGAETLFLGFSPGPSLFRLSAQDLPQNCGRLPPDLLRSNRNCPSADSVLTTGPFQLRRRGDRHMLGEVDSCGGPPEVGGPRPLVGDVHLSRSADRRSLGTGSLFFDRPPGSLGFL
jgi:hypothetical protein